MRCREFILSLEEYLDQRPAQSRSPLPPDLAAHARACLNCRVGWEHARASRLLLAALPGPGAEGGDAGYGFFWSRLRRNLELGPPVTAWGRIGARELTLAGALLVCALAVFLMNWRTTEHNSGITAGDAMVSLLTP